jgi:3-methyladenine DNA glycosylase AlkD
MPRKSASHAAFPRAIEAALAPLVNAENAACMRAYMRDRFEYLGIPTPGRRAAIKPLIRAFTPVDAPSLRAAAEALWQMREREYHYAAVDLLAYHAKVFALSDLDWLIELVQQNSWWDSVDSLVKVISRIVRAEGAKGQRRMDRALRHQDFWVRRIAMIHQLGWRGDTDTVRLFRYADLLAREQEFFIRKAIGWALRDYAWHDWRAVQRYLKTAHTRLSPLSCREAMKNFPE